MTIKELKTLGIIPNDIPDALMDQVFNRLGLGNYNPDLKISEDKISRILYSSELNDHKVRASLADSHRNVIRKYDELIKGYEDILQSIGNRAEFSTEKIAIEGLLTKLKDERKDYKDQINSFGTKNVSQYFAFGSDKNVIEQGTSEVFRNLAEKTQEQQNQIEKQLDKLYKKLDLAKGSRTKTLTGKMKNAIRVRNLESKINKLRGKQGKIRNTQSKIVNANTNMYISKMDRKFDKYFKELNQINDIIEDKKFMHDEIQESLNEKNDMDLNAINIQANMVNANAFGRMVLNAQNRKNQRNKEKLQRHIDRLQKKAGKVDLTQQYSETFSRSYSR